MFDLTVILYVNFLMGDSGDSNLCFKFEISQ